MLNSLIQIRRDVLALNLLLTVGPCLFQPTEASTQENNSCFSLEQMIHSIALRLEKRENVVGWDVQVTTIVEESFIDRSTPEINRGELEG